MKIAQRFNAGLTATILKSRRDVRDQRRKFNLPLSRPFGTRTTACGQPSVETLGYYQKSLRDKHHPACFEFPNGIKPKGHFYRRRANGISA